MLGSKDAVATLAVKNAKTAGKFYQGILGLKQTGAGEGWITYQSGNSPVLVYESQYAGTNKATAVGWVVGDELEEIVKALKVKGVTFEHYDNLPGTTRKGDVHVAENIKLAWFKDPDGNILNIASQ
jgi:catechol-2,3-dioxygenase